MKSLHLCFTSLLLQDVLTGFRQQGLIIQTQQPNDKQPGILWSYATNKIQQSDPEVIVFKYQPPNGACQGYGVGASIQTL